MPKQIKRAGRGISVSSRIPEVAMLRGQNKSAAQITKSMGLSAATLNQRIIPALNIMQQVTKIIALHNQADFTDPQIATIMDVDESFVQLVLNDYQDNIDKWTA